MNLFSYVTLATEDKYLDGAYNLYITYKKTNSKYPFLCMVGDDVDCSKYPDMPVRVVSKVHRMDSYLRNWTRILSKVDIWELLDYEYVLFLDADIILYKNIDDIVDKYIAMDINEKQIICCPVNTDGIDRCWGGTLFVKPSLKAYRIALGYIPKYLTDEELWKILGINEEFDFIFSYDIINNVYHFPNQVVDNQMHKYGETEIGRNLFSDFLKGEKTIKDIDALSTHTAFKSETQT